MSVETSDPKRAARIASVAEVALLAAAATGLQDVEAGLLAAAGAVLLLLTRWRKGTLGLVGLGVLAVDVAVWMGPGAFSNLTHDEGFIETALPSLLTVAAATSLVTALLALLRRRSTNRLPVIVLAIGVVLCVGAAIAAAVGSGTGVAAAPGDLRVDMKNVRFSNSSLDADAGRIGVFVSNEDLFWHTFTVPELDVDVNVPVGAERRATFVAEPGTYRFVCTIPGHTQAGMEGTLTVR